MEMTAAQENERDRERELRNSALDYAVRTAGETNEEIVLQAARKYLEFLKAGDKP